jgi:hypothetical protein
MFNSGVLLCGFGGRFPRGAVMIACAVARCAIVRVMTVPANRWP